MGYGLTIGTKDGRMLRWKTINAKEILSLWAYQEVICQEDQKYFNTDKRKPLGILYVHLDGDIEVLKMER